MGSWGGSSGGGRQESENDGGCAGSEEATRQERSGAAGGGAGSQTVAVVAGWVGPRAVAPAGAEGELQRPPSAAATMRQGSRNSSGGSGGWPTKFPFSTHGG